MTPTIFVIGDLLLDHYVEGFASHISPEAPTPVLVEEQRYTRPGGAWNVCANIMAAGSRVLFFGADGPSPLRTQIANETFEAKSCFILEDTGRTSQIKTRFLGQYGQQMLRCDTMKDGPISDEQAGALHDAIIQAAAEFTKPDAIVIADYGCGTVTQHLMQLLVGQFAAPIIVDPYPTTDPEIYQGVQVLKMNVHEFDRMEEMIGHEGVFGLADTTITTHGADPVAVYDRHTNGHFLVNPPYRELVDACGAGDAFIAYFAHAMARGEDLYEAATLGVHAGACAISHRGVHVVTRDEVQASIEASRT